MTLGTGDGGRGTGFWLRRLRAMFSAYLRFRGEISSLELLPLLAAVAVRGFTAIGLCLRRLRAIARVSTYLRSLCARFDFVFSAALRLLGEIGLCLRRLRAMARVSTYLCSLCARFDFVFSAPLRLRGEISLEAIL